MARRAVCQRRWDDEDTCAALLQTNQTLLKSFDYLPLAKRYCDRLSPMIPRTIKFLASLLEPACILYRYIAARLGCGSAANLYINVLKSIGQCDRGTGQVRRLGRASRRGGGSSQSGKASIEACRSSCPIDPGHMGSMARAATSAA